MSTRGSQLLSLTSLMALVLLDVGMASGQGGRTAQVPCPPDAVRVGPRCLDIYEASVWRVADEVVIGKIRKGTVTLAELQAANAVPAGLAPGDLAATGCADAGQGCLDHYAVSIAGVPPARFVSWYQALAAARNAGKELPTNGVWRAGALGSPDGPPCVVSAPEPGPTGTPGCLSDVGAFDMVGNLAEFLAEWIPFPKNCAPPQFGTGDLNCMAGATDNAGPGIMAVGGALNDGPGAGVHAVYAILPPAISTNNIGFRGMR